MILEKINNTLDAISELETHLANMRMIEREMHHVCKTASNCLLELKSPKNRFKLNALLVRKINAEIAITGEQEDAILKIAEDFGLSIETVRWIYIHANKSKKALKRFSLHFTAIKMHDAGFSAKDIARTLNLSEKYVYKLLSANIPLDL